MKKIIRVIFLVSCLVIFSSLITCFPAKAVLRQHHDSPGVLRYHAQNSLQDNSDMTWQVILFGEYDAGQVAKYHLRLVGFPGIARFIHPQSLAIITNNGQLLSARDAIANNPPAANVGEFYLTNILPMLPENSALEVSINLQGNQNLSLKIPESTVTEWQLLFNSNK